MTLGSLRRRGAVCALGTAVLVGVTTAGPTAPAAATADEFRPLLVTVAPPRVPTRRCCRPSAWT